MSLKMRRIIIASALLLAVFAALAFRLNIESINNHVRQKMESYVDVGLKAETSSFSFLTGIGLRLDKVTLKQKHYRVEAQHMDVGIRLLPLLLGKVEVDSLDIHDAVVFVRAKALQPTSAAISSLPFERIRLVRSQIRTFDGHDLLNNLHMELRNIGVNREALWELQARQENHSLSGHGRLNFYNGEISTGFGKFKFDQVPVERLQTVTPASLFSWFEGSQGSISGALTLDINRNQRWAVFGELSLQESSDAPPLRLRGKLEHPGRDLLVWRDSFIHFNNRAVIAIDGKCRKSACETALKATNVELETWFPMMPKSTSFHKRMSGQTYINTFVQWDDKGWKSSASLKLKNASYRYKEKLHPLPDITLQTSKLRGDSRSWRGKALLTSPVTAGEIIVEGAQKRFGTYDINIHTNSVDAPLWQPLTNFLLSSLEVDPLLSAKGLIDGSIQLQQNSRGKTLKSTFNARDANISYPSLFSKPKHVEANCSAEISWTKEDSRPKSVVLKSCLLDQSSLKSAKWRGGAEQQLKAKGLSIHFDQLRSNGITLPEEVNAFHGAVKGSGSTKWKGNIAKNSDWTNHLKGQWKLQNFGRENWHASGTIKANNRQLQSSELLLSGAFGQAKLKGTVDLGSNKSEVDILDATANLSALPSPPPFIEKMEMRGRIHQANLTLLENELTSTHGYYRTHKKRILLENIQGSIASGQLLATKMDITPTTGSYKVDGNVRMKGVHTDLLKGLQSHIKADLKGKLHANIELHGKLPEMNVASWRHSNGDIAIYNGTWRKKSIARKLAGHLGIGDGSHIFNALSFRFRIREGQTDIKHITLDHDNIQLQGKAKIAHSGTIQGKVESSDKKVTYDISGAWPVPSWELQ